MADPKFIPVDDDPFAESTGPKLVPVDGDPFADSGLKVTQVDDDPFDGQEPISDSWLEVGKKVLENAPTQLKAGLAGLQQKVAEQPPTVLGSLMMPVPITGKPGDPTIPDFLSMLQKQGSDWLRDKMGLEPDKGAEVAAKAFADTQADLQENAPNVDPNSLKGYAYDTAGSFIQMLPGIAAGLATKSPAVGVTTMAAPIAGERYAQSRTAGRTPSQATEDATVTGLAEAIPEMIPLGFLMKPGKKFLARTLGTMGLGGASEMLTQAIEDGYAKGVLNEDMTWGDVWNNMKRAGIIGTVSEGAAAVVTHPFVKESSPGAGNTAGDAAGPPTGESAGLPSASPPPTGGPATTTPPDAPPPAPPERQGPWSKPIVQKDATVGLKMGERPPVRATIEGIQDGWVFWRDEDGNQQTDREEEFRRDLTTPPPARRGDQGVATEPSGLPTPPPVETGDINDFDPWAVREPSRRARTEDTGQSSMNLPETKQIQNLLDSARYMQATAAEAQRILDSGSPNARTPQDIALMRTQAAKALDEAAELQRKLTPARASQDATAATPEQMAARGLGPLAAAAPAASEATTGAQQFAVTPPKAPPAAAQGALAPVEGSEAENPQEPQFTPKAVEVPWQQRLRQRIADRSARVSMPSLLAKQFGVTPAEVTNELKTIAGSSPKSPIRMIATRMGGETSEGLFRYAPKPTGKVTQSLSDLVYDSGGMAAGSFAGELEARDLHTAKRQFKGALVRPLARMNVQDMADHALQLGWGIKPDETGDHADVDDFLNKLEQDEAGGRKFYARGESPEELGLDQGKGRPQATPADRKAAALARLDQLGFKPQGTTHQELEQQIDDYENAIGDFEPNDTLDFQRAMEQENVGRLNDEAKAALKEESREDYPDGYDAEWFASETRGSPPAALDEAAGGDEESGGAAGTEPNGESTAEGGGESANEAAAESGEAPGAETQTSRASTSQSGPTLPPQIIDKTAEAAAFIENGGTPSNWVLQEGKRTGHEHLVIMVGDKAVGATTSGSPHEVAYVAEQPMYDPKQAVIIYHNHPLPTALSADDIRALGYPGTSFIVAVSHDGKISAASLAPGVHRWLAGFQAKKNTGFLENIYRQIEQGMRSLGAEKGKSQELTLRALAGAGIIEYHSDHPIEGDQLVAIKQAAEAVRSLFEKAGIETNRASNRSTFHAGSGRSLEAISRRHGEIRAERQADPTLRDLGGPSDRGKGGGTATARNASEPGADRRSNDGRDSQSPTGVIARLIEDETGALDLDAWKKIRQLLRRGRASEGPAAAREVAREGLKIPIGQANTLQSLSLPARWFRTAVSLASIDRPSSIYWNALLRRDHVKTTLEREAIDAARPYLGLDVKARDRINKVLEHDRLFGIDRSNTGRTVVVKIPDRKPPFGERPELSKPGEIVALDKAESDALNSLRKFFDKRLMQMGEAAAVERGYNGEFTKAAIEERIRSANRPRERTIAAQALDIFNQTENMRRTGYVPFQRYGDTYIVIKPKANAEDETAWFELVSTKSAFDKVFSRPGGKNSLTLDERVAALKERFPEADYDYQIAQATPKAIADLNIPAMEKAFASLNVKADKDTAKVIDQLMTQIFEARKAGLRKQANNVPGYSTDFERAIVDYVRQSSTIVAHVSSRNDVDSAYETVQKHPTTEVRDYWEAHQHHMEKEGGDYAGLRKFGFFMFLWGNPAGAAVNLTVTPLVTQMQLATWAGMRAPGLAHGAMLEGLQAIRVGENGLEIDFDKVGKTDAEKTMIRTLQAEGRLDPVLSNEFQGFDRGRSKVRPHMKALGRVHEAGASMFSTTETVNRIAAALAYFRAAQNEQLREKAAKVYANDHNWQEMVGRFPQPIDIARFGVDETQFIGGKLNRMPAMRGIGGVVLQFKTYIANYLRLLHKNATRMGPQGKAAAAAMLIALIMTSGLAGLPFGEDALNAVDGIMKLATGIDHNLEYQFRNWLDDAGFGEYWAEVATRGFGRNAFGLDVGGRLGMGNLFPDNSFTSLAPVVTGTVGNIADAIERYKSGQPIGAAAAATPMFAGSGVANAIKGLVQYPNEGVATKRGNPLYWPDEVTTADMAIKALGFQPTRVTRAGEREFQAGRIANATKDARASMLTNLTRNMILEEKARKAGDKEAANKYQARIDALMAENAAQLLDPSIPDWQKMKPPSRLGIKRRVQSMLAPDIARMKRASKLSREELSDLPFVDDE